MVRRNIYEGPNSCYAINEGIYVPGRGVNLETGVSILYLLLRDLQRGWTYDHSCRRIPMTWDLFVRRARYLYALCRKHTGPLGECERLREIIEYAIARRTLPPWARSLVRLARTRPLIAVPVVVRRRRLRASTYY